MILFSVLYGHPETIHSNYGGIDKKVGAESGLSLSLCLLSIYILIICLLHLHPLFLTADSDAAAVNVCARFDRFSQRVAPATAMWTQ